ncbi:MAG: bifunctional diaminohydroxyphosphoribosylaminopyrimidine deaminase/5-amino-6-(5-phosphoribosylamino)uracil reductase RibD [bacterium]|nr:bifunctional diaminohydroxyphosphoribosylaminopyrimidine deaminase/5-amino-6-(5-phosphoribosylamino)uracil reductase RibD [bacterium]
MPDDIFYMRKVFELAKLGEGFTSPNPMVGAVIVKEGRIVGIGYHKKKGDKHAEIRAIEDAVGHLEGSTLYINLEPCVHHGSTPPCAPVVAQSGIKRVVISNIDPNPLVSGKGVEYLRSKGIEVLTGVLEEEGYFLNRFFFHYMKTGFPYVIGKMALSMDGFIADNSGNSKWITGEDSRKYVHKLRGDVDAIMVGKGTIEKDNPSLLPRLIYSPRVPAKVVVARKPFKNFDYQIFDSEGMVYVLTVKNSEWRVPSDLRANIELVEVGVLENGAIDLREALVALGKRGIQSILCEGGSFLMGELLKLGLVQELVIFYSNLILGSGLKPFGGISLAIDEAIKDFKLFERLSFQNDIMVRFLKND